MAGTCCWQVKTLLGGVSVHEVQPEAPPLGLGLLPRLGLVTESPRAPADGVDEPSPFTAAVSCADSVAHASAEVSSFLVRNPRLASAACPHQHPPHS